MAVAVFEGTLEKLKACVACGVDPKPKLPAEDVLVAPNWKPPAC